MILHAFTLVVALVAFAVPLPSSRTGVGPVAIAMLDGHDRAAILQSDGDVIAMNLISGAVADPMYRIPAGYRATDMTASRSASGTMLAFVISGNIAQAASESLSKHSFILQRQSDGREVWAWMRAPGLYLHLTIDDSNRPTPLIYTANLSTNTIYRIVAGDEKHSAQEVIRLASARRLGAMAFDTTTQRLFVTDLDDAPIRIHVIDVAQRRTQTVIVLDKVDDIRSLVWDAGTARLYAADSGQERIWRIDPTSSRTGRTRVDAFARHERMKQPIGLALMSRPLASSATPPTRTMWVVDHSARTALQLSMPDGIVTRLLSCELP